ncbi:MAG: YigZ family protein [Pseudomonadota bacterium]
MTYDTPAAEAAAEIEIKKSRFIAHARRVGDRQAAMAWLAELKAAYPDARHHCWAYLLGDPTRASSAAMGDDGEPSGTAGKPILNVLQHKGVGDVMIIVVRYFGGIKLGAGGLTRAYGQAAQAVMEVLPVAKRETRITLTVRCGFAQEQGIRHWLSLHDGQVTGVDYGQAVRMQLELPEAGLEAWLSYGRAHGIEVMPET